MICRQIYLRNIMLYLLQIYLLKRITCSTVKLGTIELGIMLTLDHHVLRAQTLMHSWKTSVFRLTSLASQLVFEFSDLKFYLSSSNGSQAHLIDDVEKMWWFVNMCIQSSWELKKYKSNSVTIYFHAKQVIQYELILYITIDISLAVGFLHDNEDCLHT